MISRLAAFLFILGALFVASEALRTKGDQQKMGSLPITTEQKELFQECEKVHEKLKDQNLPTQFSYIDFRIRDERLKKDPIMDDFNKCFQRRPGSSYRLEVEIFSSDYENEQSPDLQVQISVIAVMSENKVAEVGFRLNHVPQTRRR